MQVVKQLGRYLGPYKFFTLIAPILMVLEVTMDLIQPTIMQHMIDTGIANGDNPYVFKMFVLMLMSAVLGLVGGLGALFIVPRRLFTLPLISVNRCMKK